MTSILGCIINQNLNIKVSCALTTDITNIIRWGYAFKKSLQQGSVWFEIESYVSEVKEAIGCVEEEFDVAEEED